jgi:hypothetical protein
MLKKWIVLLSLPCVLSCLLLQAAKTTNIQEGEVSSSINEIDAISLLIQDQQRHLDRQIELQNLMKLFKQQKEEFMAGKQTQKHAMSMVLTAREILQGINDEKIAYLFPSEYLEELVFFSSVAGKSKPVRP